ncbi:hypothetical protein [Micromonospora sp. NPDC005979]|uniref:hypothetical protein n=1 Tax=Micromonospora sp. NPDC005979 TaxID=3156726 RepID=UPI0033A6F17F
MSIAPGPRWIIHLPTTLTSLDEVTALAVALRDSLGHLAVVDFGETTLSEEDAQFLRTRVFCDARLGDARPVPAARRPRRPLRNGDRLGFMKIGVSAAGGHPDFIETVLIKRRVSRR